MSRITMRKSGVANKKPVVSDLVVGELAVNYADGKLYLLKDNGTTQSIVEVGALTFASQAEAEAGVNTTKVMSPRRVADAIAYLADPARTLNYETPNRSPETWYQNTTGAWMMLFVRASNASATMAFEISPNMSTIMNWGQTTSGVGTSSTIIVPPGWYVRIRQTAGTSVIQSWLEYRV